MYTPSFKDTTSVYCSIKTLDISTEEVQLWRLKLPEKLHVTKQELGHFLNS